MTTLLLNSLLSSALATLLAVGFGVIIAVVFCTLPGTGRSVLAMLAASALALPPFAIVNCWLHYLGNIGVWRTWLPVEIFNVWGVASILGLMLWPIPFAAALGVWRTLDASHLDAEPALRGWPLLRWLLLPAASKALAAGAVLTFALALNQFSVPAILQVKVLPVEIWIRFSTELRAGDALAVSWPLVLIPLAAWIFLKQVNFRWQAETGTATARGFRRQLGRGWLVAGSILTVAIITASVGLPLFQLLSGPRTWSELPSVLRATAPVLVNTLAFAAFAALFAAIIGVLLWRIRMAAVLWILFLLPGMLLSIAVIWLLNRPGLEVIYRSAAVMVIVLCARFAGPVWALVRQGFGAVDPTLLEAARLEGLRGWSLFRHVYWPKVAPAIAAAWYVAYLLCLWDVETTTLLYPPGAETLAIRVFNLLHYGHTAQVNALCLMLLALAVAPALICGAARALFGRRPM